MNPAKPVMRAIDKFQQRRPVLAFPIAVFLTKMRPEHYLRQVIQTNTELSVAIMAAPAVCQRSLSGFPANNSMDRLILTTLCETPYT